MRQIYKKRKRLTWHGLLQTIIIVFFHFLFYAAYLGIWEIVGHFGIGKPFFFYHVNSTNWILFYFLLIVPLLSSIFHLLYRDTGIVLWRMLIWVFSICGLFAIPLIVLI